MARLRLVRRHSEDVEKMWAADAFELRMKQQPTSPRTPGSLLLTGWKWVDYAQVPGAVPGSVLVTVRSPMTHFPLISGSTRSWTARRC